MTTANTARANSARANTPIIPAAVADVSQTINRPYFLEIRDSAGDHQSFLPDWHTCTRRAAVNEPETLTFTVPEDSIAIPSLIGFNEIWLHRGTQSVPIQKYEILVTEDLIGSTPGLRVEADSYLGQLAREYVTHYETTANQTLEYIVSAILSTHQTQDRPIKRGNIHASVGSTTIQPVRFNNKSILAILQELRAYVGGYFSVDVGRRLNWSTTAGTTQGHWIRLGHNALDIKRRKDYRALATRVVGHGQGVDDATRLKSTQDDASAQTTYGVIQRPIFMQHIDDSTLLDTMTTAELDRLKGPKITYDVGLIDLFHADSTSYDHLQHLIEPGTRVKLIHDSPAIDIDTTILNVEWLLDNPEQVKINQSNEDNLNDPTNATKKDPLDVIVDLIERTNEQSNDTGIIADLLHQIAGGTFATPATPPLGGPEDIIWWDESADVGNLDEKIVDVIDNNTDATAQATIEDAIARAINNVIAAEGASPHDNTTYVDYVAVSQSYGIAWGGEVGVLPTLPTAQPTVVYYTVDDQLYIGYDNGGDSPNWTPLQITTDDAP